MSEISYESHGNGWAYTLTDEATGETVFLQDDDANEITKIIEDLDIIWSNIAENGTTDFPFKSWEEHFTACVEDYFL